MNFKTKPPIRWVGGKRKLLEQLKSKMPDTYNRYYEPFIGGGALFFDVQPENAVINDVNQQLLNVYHQLKINPEAVIVAIEELNKVPCDKERYYLVRECYNKKIQAQELDVQCAALMIWINMHCFNALYRVNKKGLFNVSYNNKVTCASFEVENLRNIGTYLQNSNVEIREGDFEKACEDVQPGDFVYFDSPYAPLNATETFTQYTKDGFGLEDHKRLADLFRRLDSLGAKLLLSNHDGELVRELYKGYKIESVDVQRMICSIASKRTTVKEVIITNY